jgi:hypothetical protein
VAASGVAGGLVAVIRAGCGVEQVAGGVEPGLAGLVAGAVLCARVWGQRAWAKANRAPFSGPAISWPAVLRSSSMERASSSGQAGQHTLLTCDSWGGWVGRRRRWRRRAGVDGHRNLAHGKRCAGAVGQVGPGQGRGPAGVVVAGVVGSLGVVG